MKTVLFRKLANCVLTALIGCFICITAGAQTYNTRANGAWNSASTWQGGSVPPSGTIPSGAVINIRHRVTYSGSSIDNNGTININNTGTISSARLLINGGIDIRNRSTGRIYVINAELRQYRYVGGLETGVAQTGELRNEGYFESQNSFIEIAKDWKNEFNGVVVFRNSSLVLGQGFETNNNTRDTIEMSSISLGLHGTGNFRAAGGNMNFRLARIEVASLLGEFALDNGIVNGTIEHISLRNHITGALSTNGIIASNNINSSAGLFLNTYCKGVLASYLPNGKISGPQNQNCSVNYFPAGLLSALTGSSFNLSNAPNLISGTNLQAGATYKYESAVPGVDVIVRIDSLIRGSAVTMLDDNSGAGYVEGFQPQIRSGSPVGQSYAVFSFQFKVTGTNSAYALDTFSLTALDIDGQASLREFDQINMGPGATVSYSAANPYITVSQVVPGGYRGVNNNGQNMNGIDTSAKRYMYTVKNSNITGYTLKMGAVTTQSTQTTRLYSMYMKGFVYPQGSTLPVKLDAFTANLDAGNQVKLNWLTSSEENLSHFVIEKSQDGINYTDLATVFSMGSHSVKAQYYYTDPLGTLRSGTFFYRLRAVDIDGEYQYSATRVIRMAAKTNNNILIQAFPNPVSSDLKVTIPSSWQNKKVRYELITTTGQKVFNMEPANSSQTENINTSKLQPGLYFVRVSCEGEIAEQKIIKY